MKSASSAASVDFAQHADRLTTLSQHANPQLRSLFEKGRSIYIARAPGRLDVMGGFGDYSGSLVLELPTAEAAFAAAQKSADGAVTIASRRAGDHSHLTVTTIAARDWAELRAGDYNEARSFLSRDPQSAWAAYIAGPILVLLRESGFSFDGGLRVLIDSNVPEGKGVSSSAAIEVATMRAVAALLGIDLSGDKLAQLCQLAENCVVGAPCGIMDQVTSAVGRENELLALRCQPAMIEGFVPIPDKVAFWGIDSGVRHSVGGADYSTVRCGAFMGYRIIAEAAAFGAGWSESDSSVVEVDDPTWNGYLANLTPEEFQARFASVVPAQLSGCEFLQRYAGTTDYVTRVDPDRVYAVRAPTLHPIEENVRANRFRTLLQNPISDDALRELGQLMSAAHASYSACGLGSEGTDLLVDLVHEAGPSNGLFGAKITGGGSGGAVVVLGRADADDAVSAVAQRYSQLTGRKTYIFRGSSPGAYGTPVREVVI